MTESQKSDTGRAIDLVIFDCDGVLVDSEYISCSVLAEAMTRHGAPMTVQDVFQTFLGRPAYAVLEMLVERSGNPSTEAFVADWRSALFTKLRAELQAIDGIAAAIDRMGLPRCVASSSDAERIHISLTKAGILDKFDGNIFNTAMVRNGKPAPDLFLLAASTMGHAPERCVVVEDSESGIRAAKAAGMTAIGFTGGSHYKVLEDVGLLLKAGADYIITHMDQLPPLVQALSTHE